MTAVAVTAVQTFGAVVSDAASTVLVAAAAVEERVVAAAVAAVVVAVLPGSWTQLAVVAAVALYSDRYAAASGPCLPPADDAVAVVALESASERDQSACTAAVAAAVACFAAALWCAVGQRVTFGLADGGRVRRQRRLM